MDSMCLPFSYGNTAQFGKKPQPGFLAQFKVWKTKEYCMYFSFFKLKKWGKKTAAARRHNCAVLPYNFMKKLYGARPGLPVRIKEAHAIIIFPDSVKSHFSFGRQLLPRVSKIYHSSLE